MPIPAHRAFLPAPLVDALWAAAEPVEGVPGLRVAPGLQADFPDLENAEILGLVVEVHREVRAFLAEVLEERLRVRAFADAYALAAVERNAGRRVSDPDHDTVVGARDAQGLVLIGPSDEPPPEVRVEVPEHLRGHQVTLFGPPDTARMAIHAMNAVHRRRPDEPELVARLVAQSQVPRWGADSEDSKTPLARDLLRATRNLARCIDGTLRLDDPDRGRVYALAADRRSIPIKRVPGLALPDGHHLLDGVPLPLHLLEVVRHVWLHRDRPDARVIYVPKLESEAEAAYVAALLRATERAVGARHPSYPPGSVRVLVVFEHPRAVFRVREMAAALQPYFLGGSLGWHDFLASTARLFRHDPKYRIPVKADPDIVIRNIRESHLLLARQLGPMGALKVGGMYGVLFHDDDPRSYAVSVAGFVRDVVTQLRRGLDGFWVAHPDFVRPGIALVEAWRRRERNPADPTLRELVAALVPDAAERERALAFLETPDAPGLDPRDPRYLRAVLAAEHEVSPVVANDDPEEVRYNIFQALQYLADWLCGNGCVALPATLVDARGAPVSVRIMDDLATTERSRWELWAEVHHGRVPVALFDAILEEEVAFLRRGDPRADRRVQVRWEGEAARWYPVAVRILRQLVLDPEPPEFVTELLLPFTLAPIRHAADPWAAASALCPGRYEG